MTTPVKLHRPYARIRKKPERSVTEVIGTKSIPGLEWAATKACSRKAVLDPESWEHMSDDEAIDFLRRHHRGLWDSRAAMGTATHAVMEGWIEGETIELDDLIATMAASTGDAKSWQGREDEIVETLGLYVDGLEKFWNDWQPTNSVTEQCVRYPGKYVGQRDLSTRLCDGLRWLLDIKTTAQEDAEKGVYGDSWRLQLVAYDRAPEIVHYGLNEKNKVVELGTEPNERHDRCGIIHLRGDGEYTLFDVTPADADWDAFLELEEFNRWLHSVPAPVAMAPPHLTEGVA